LRNFYRAIWAASTNEESAYPKVCKTSDKACGPEGLKRKILPSLTKQHRDILPNRGRLEEAVLAETKKNLEMIPGSKKRSKD
jgi:hypothetical protein